MFLNSEDYEKDIQTDFRPDWADRAAVLQFRLRYEEDAGNGWKFFQYEKWFGIMLLNSIRYETDFKLHSSDDFRAQGSEGSSDLESPADFKMLDR